MKLGSPRAGLDSGLHNGYGKGDRETLDQLLGRGQGETAAGHPHVCEHQAEVGVLLPLYLPQQAHSAPWWFPPPPPPLNPSSPAHATHKHLQGLH